VTIPFGALVNFKPTAGRSDLQRWDPPAERGVFAGYHLHPGYEWRGEYMVWKLTAFAKADLRCSSTHLHQGVDKPHIVKMCVLPANGLSFPLKVHYESVNKDIFNPLIVNEEYEPAEEARAARGFPLEAEEPPQEEGNEGLHAPGIDIYLGNPEEEGEDVEDLPPLPPPC